MKICVAFSVLKKKKGFVIMIFDCEKNYKVYINIYKNNIYTNRIKKEWGKKMHQMLKQRKVKSLSLIIIDFISVLISYYFVFILKAYSQEITLNQINNLYLNEILYIIFAAIIYIVSLAFFKQYKSIWTLAGVDEFFKSISAIIIGFISNIIILNLINKNITPFEITISALIILMLCSGVRLTYRLLRRAKLFNETNRLYNKDKEKRVLIIGAGGAGSIVVNEFKKYKNLGKKVVALVDDDKEKLGTYLCGVKVIGNRNDIQNIAKEKNIDEIIIAIANLNKQDLKNIINKCKETKVQVKIMPGLSEMIDGKFSINNIREVEVEDLLGRESIKLDYEGISDYLENKVVLVTGGGGSIGSELCRQISKFKPKKLIIFDIYENNAYEIQNELLRNYPELDLVTLIGSVRDRKRLSKVYSNYKPNVVFHAAAHKHVPLMEVSPLEAIKNNVMGTFNVAEYANNFGVERFVLISTDKAVNPTNIMGATKRICEMIIQAFDKESDTEFVAVRFGNVLGSNGSVVPLFKKQISKGGPVTLTHRDITRYFMTIPEASQLVLQAGAYASGGEIFVLDMGEPVKIYDLAENLIKLSGFEPHKEIEIKVTGLRPGEKLYEELLMEEEGLEKTNHKKIFIGKPSNLDLDHTVEDIVSLMNVAKTENESLIKEKLKEVVKTYKEPNEIQQEVAISKA